MPTIKHVNFTPDGLLAIIEDLERSTAQPKAVQEMMLRLKLENADIPKATEALKGVKAIGSFVKAAQYELTDHRLGITKEK